jgi:DNA-cytosine methyltransferase
MKFNILDIFSGAGGFSLGFDRYDNYETLIACDFDQKALYTFEKNFPKAKTICGDLTNSEVKNKIVQMAYENQINMIIGGPPCQGFSLQGKKLGINDPRNFLFMEFVDLVERISPEVFVLENVKNMINAESGYFIKEIVKEFEKIGYVVSFEILNSKNFGVPQKRERSFVVGSKTKKIILQNEQITNLVDVRDSISDLAFLESGEGLEKQHYKLPENSNYQKTMRMNSKNLYNHVATNHSDIAIKKLKLIPPESGKEFLPKEMLGNQKFSSTWSRLKWNDQSPTIDTRFDTPSNGRNSHPFLNRSITPREAARLQSFPDDFVFYGNKTSICKQIGNAVPPLLSSYIASTINSYYNINSIEYLNNSHIINADCIKISDQIETIDHIITDPPYNISKKNNFGTMNNKKSGVDFGEWDKNFSPSEWIKNYVPKVKKGGTIIIFCSYLYISDIIKELENHGCEVKDIIRWIKNNPMPRNMSRRYVSDSEFAIWAVKCGAKWIFNNNSTSYLRPEFRTSVVSGKEKVGHPTQKSLELMNSIIKIHTNESDVILDPFMGSGTTCVSCLINKRRFIGIEKNYDFYKMADNRIRDVLNK